MIYAFTEDPQVQEKILKSTMSGNFVFNDTFQQLASNDIPFGGVGESGRTLSFRFVSLPCLSPSPPFPIPDYFVFVFDFDFDLLSESKLTDD